MKRNILFLLTLIALYVLISLGLSGVYGDSYPLWPGDNYWRPDGQLGWEAVGAPGEPMPTEPSVNIPTPLVFLPFLVPGLLLALMMLTPLGRILETPRPASGPQPEPEEVNEESDRQSGSTQ